MNFYSGIGSRDTPEYVLEMMINTAQYLAQQGWVLRSGAASGADKAFEFGCDMQNGVKEIYLPWKDYNNSKSTYHPANYPFNIDEIKFAANHHPAWNNCNTSARLMHTRNGRIIQGLTQELSKFVICWTENGSVKGGTGQGIRMAIAKNIPIINLGKASSKSELRKFTYQIENLAKELKT